MASAATRTPDVGVSMLVKPSPNWKASTIAWRETPTRSENGAMMGMVMAALAVALGRMKLITAWMAYMAVRDDAFPLPSRPSCIRWRMLSTTCPSCRMTMMPEANPTTSAAERISRAPARNSSAMRLAEKPAMMPQTMPISRNRPVISGIYQSQQVTPTTRATTVTRRTASTHFCRRVMGCGAATACPVRFGAFLLRRA